MSIEFRAALDYGVSQSLELLNRGFSDYIVPIQLNLPSFFEMLRTANIDLTLSQVLFDGDDVVGLGLIARRGWSSRLAAMAIIPEKRGKKFGISLLKHLVNQAVERGDQRIELEVIAQNDPAVRLYQSFGFEPIRRLCSFQVENPPGHIGAIRETDIRRVASFVNLYGFPNLPWQISGETLSAFGPPYKAFNLKAAYVVISDPSQETISLRALITLPDSRRQRQGKNLIKALFSQFPEKKWAVPAIFPEEMGDFFQSCGFKRQELSQFQMEKILK